MNYEKIIVELLSRIKDLEEKVDYYLSHEKEREEIRANGCRKVRQEHNYRSRIEMMMRIVTGE